MKEKLPTQEVIMNKSLLKEINSLIKDLDKYDYILRVKYVIYSVSKILYDCKTYGVDILDKSFQFYKSTPNFKLSVTNIFFEHKNFNINDAKAEEKVFNLIFRELPSGRAL